MSDNISSGRSLNVTISVQHIMPLRYVLTAAFRKLFTLAALTPAAVLIFSFAMPIVAQDDDEEATRRAIAFFNEGQDAHEAGDLTGAIKLYEAAIKEFDLFPEAELQRGSALLSLDRMDEAEKAFRRAVELRDDWTLALANLGGVLVRKGLYAEAEPFLLKAIKLDTQNFPAYSALTEMRLSDGSSETKRRELLASVTVLTQKANPPVSIWIARAALENSLSDYRSSAASSAAALEIDRSNTGALANAARAAFGLQDVARAKEFVAQLERIDPESDTTKTLQLNVLIETEEYDQALKLIASMIYPTAEVLTLRDRIVSVRSTNTDELEKRLAQNPGDLPALERLCTIYRTKEPQRALDFCRRASEADPNSIKHVIGYGAALLTAGRYAESAMLMQRLIRIEPDNVTIRANLATALFQLKKFSDAKLQFQWLAEKQPDVAATYYFLGVTHDQLKEYLDAMANYQLFLRLADRVNNEMEIERVNLRLPALQRQINSNKGRRNE